MLIRFYIYRPEKIKEKTIEVTDKNNYEIRFLLETIIKTINHELKELKRKGIITSFTRNTKINNRKYRNKVKNLLFSKQSINNSLNLIKTI